MSMGVIFLAHANGVPLGLGQQLGILGIMLLTSKGTATVSGGSFVVFAATVTATGVLPVEGLAICSASIASCPSPLRPQRHRQQHHHGGDGEDLWRVRWGAIPACLCQAARGESVG
ncbi:MAG TPA: cation:dicarboxylase symporter family transporter [Roseomonas sp.]|nr:cation:dicarboxylase symporter family transporter [Roseomonas sp.]